MISGDYQGGGSLCGAERRGGEKWLLPGARHDIINFFFAPPQKNKITLFFLLYQFHIPPSFASKCAYVCVHCLLHRQLYRLWAACDAIFWVCSTPLPTQIRQWGVVRSATNSSQGK